MSATHTTGLLTITKSPQEPAAYLVNDQGMAVARVINTNLGGVHDENARRLVACWNSFDGADTGLIEQVDKLGNCTLPYRLLKVSHAELLSAARDCLEREYNDFEPDNQSNRYHDLKSIIDKADALAAEYGRRPA